ncbi:MAG TPA: ATP-binding protein [Verrucomicrobiae bacterium]|nr:ATP-binding protein [Verrucomicrobiae bacterium]
MNSRPSQRRFTVKAKVLFPVVTIMVVLVVSLLCIANHRMTAQVQAEAGRRLATARAVFSNSQRIRAKHLLMRFSNIVNEPRIEAASQLGEPKTMLHQLNELVGEVDADMITYTSANGRPLASVHRDPELNLTEFESTASSSIRKALEGQPNVDTISVSARLFDVVSVPISVSDHLVGVLTIGTEIGDAVAHDFQQLTHSEIALFTHGRVAASTLSNLPIHDQFVATLGNHFPIAGTPQEVLLGGEHYLAMAGRFPSLSGDERLGYVLYSSYEQPLAALRATQRVLLLLGVLVIALSTAVVWVLIGRITRPLRQLREMAERVGRGDFSQRVDIETRDECGELAVAFNQMTGNLKTSLDELEKTVENLKNTKAQLTQSEKLSVIGEFVAGVAHELNNPLASVYGFAQMLQRPGVMEGGKHSHYLDRVLRESQRCHKIVQNLLSFARQSTPERKRINLDDLVRSALEILQYQLHTGNIEVVTDLDGSSHDVVGDSHQLQQVFVNIINNSRQAMESHASNGILRISTRVLDGRAGVSFADNGPGISPENMEKIFTPFFTTKEPGKGTGLGLSLCYGIVTEHGGALRVSSTLGQGATFVVDLPVAENAGPSGVETSETVAIVSSAPGNSGKRVLVVDDEEALRDLISDVLVAEQYDVDTASDGEAALRKTRSARYDLILCDWKMPGLNGLDFYQQLKTTNPETASHFIFLTGDVVGAQKALGTQASCWLPKPFSLDELRGAVNRVAVAV